MNNSQIRNQQQGIRQRPIALEKLQAIAEKERVPIIVAVGISNIFGEKRLEYIFQFSVAPIPMPTRNIRAYRAYSSNPPDVNSSGRMSETPRIVPKIKTPTIKIVLFIFS